jgi:DNA-binding XRE family transcriptional regulator
MTDNFIELRIMARLNRKQAAELFEVTERTIVNWDKEKIKPPKSVLLFLKLRNGDLSVLGKKWKGFYLMIVLNHLTVTFSKNRNHKMTR